MGCEGVTYLFIFSSALGIEPPSLHMLVRCSVTGRHHQYRKNDYFIWQEKGSKTKAHCTNSSSPQGKDMRCRDRSLWTHYMQWGWVTKLQLWAGIKSGRVCFLSAEKPSFPNIHPRAELHHSTENLRVKTKTQYRIERNLIK